MYAFQIMVIGNMYIGTLLIRPIGIVRFSIITRMNFMRSLLGNMNICMILTGTYVSGYANR